MVATHTQSEKQEILNKVNTRAHTHKRNTLISAESYTQQTYCQMHYISYCTANRPIH